MSNFGKRMFVATVWEALEDYRDRMVVEARKEDVPWQTKKSCEREAKRAKECLKYFGSRFVIVEREGKE